MARLTEVFRIEEGYLDDPLFDKFARSFPEYKNMLETNVPKGLGPDWKKIIDEAQGWEGATDWFIKQLWGRFYTPYEARGEIYFMYELATHDHQKQTPEEKFGGYEHFRMVPDEWTVAERYDGIYYRGYFETDEEAEAYFREHPGGDWPDEPRRKRPLSPEFFDEVEEPSMPDEFRDDGEGMQ